MFALYCMVTMSFSCATSLVLNENEYLTRPSNISVSGQAGGKFQLTYYVENTENTFDGYNLYISKESTGDAGGNQVIEAYQYTGSVPTFIHSPDEVDSVTPVTVSLDKYMQITYSLDGNKVITYVPFEEGATYFFKMKAHSQFDILSEFSTEVSDVTLP